MKTFEFIVEGPPVSLNAKKNNPKRYQRWIRTVRSAAQARWSADKKPVTSEAIIVNIVNYYTESPPDVDNIIKPILDGLEHVVCLNDRQVYKVSSERFDLIYKARIENPSPMLAVALEQYTELVHITVVWEE